MHILASDFASLADLLAFQRAKKRGLSDARAFAFGDNGVGCWGDLTAQTHTPMCALPPELMTSLFGSKAKAKHGNVKVRDVETNHECVCIVADIMPPVAQIKNGCRIDLNPAALNALCLRSPIKRPVEISRI